MHHGVSTSRSGNKLSTDKKVYIPVFHAAGHCGLRLGHYIDFLAIFGKSLKTKEISTSGWKPRKFRIHQKIHLTPCLVSFFYADADSGLQIIPTPLKNLILSQILENHDFWKSWFSKIGRNIMKTNEITIFLREESGFHHPRGRKLDQGRFLKNRPAGRWCGAAGRRHQAARPFKYRES